MLQKKAVRIVCYVNYQHHSNVLFLELHVLKLFDLIELKTAVIMYKAIKNYLPANLQIMFMMSLGTACATHQSKNIGKCLLELHKKLIV